MRPRFRIAEASAASPGAYERLTRAELCRANPRPESPAAARAASSSSRSAAEPAPIRSDVGAPNGVPDCTLTPAGEQRCGDRVRIGSDIDEDEVRRAVRMGLEPTCPQQLGEVGDRDPVRRPSPLHLGRVVEARERRDLGERADVVAALDLADRGDDGRRPDAVADPKPRQAVELRERSQGEHVVTGADEIR